MYSRASLEDLQRRDVEDIEPALKAVGYELRPSEMRPSVWEFDAGESNNRHRHEEQEELYFVVEGRFEMDVDDSTFEIETGDFVTVEPEAWRRLTAEVESTVLVVGAPNVADDSVTSK